MILYHGGTDIIENPVMMLVRQFRLFLTGLCLLILLCKNSFSYLQTINIVFVRKNPVFILNFLNPLCWSNYVPRNNSGGHAQNNNPAYQGKKEKSEEARNNGQRSGTLRKGVFYCPAYEF
jgi:hypothetical protein